MIKWLVDGFTLWFIIVRTFLMRSSKCSKRCWSSHFHLKTTSWSWRGCFSNPPIKGGVSFYSGVPLHFCQWSSCGGKSPPKMDPMTRGYPHDETDSSNQRWPSGAFVQRHHTGSLPGSVRPATGTGGTGSVPLCRLGGPPYLNWPIYTYIYIYIYISYIYIYWGYLEYFHENGDYITKLLVYLG